MKRDGLDHPPAPARDLHWIPLYQRDLRASTAHWDDELFGAYVRLLMHQADHGSIPTDLRLVGRICTSARRSWPRLSEKFPGGVNPRMDTVRREQLAKRERMVNGGRRGAAGRWGGQWGGHAPEHGEAIGYPNGEANGEANASQNQSQKYKNPPTPQAEPPVAPSGDTAVRSSRRGKVDPADLAGAEAVYAVYPRRVGRAAALKSILRASGQLERDAESNDAAWVFGELKRRVEAFAAKCKRDGTETRFIPHPATWFNRGSWDDEEIRDAAFRAEHPHALALKPSAILWSIESEASGHRGAVRRVYARDGYDRATVLANFASTASRIEEIPLAGTPIQIHPQPEDPHVRTSDP